MPKKKDEIKEKMDEIIENVTFNWNPDLLESHPRNLKVYGPEPVDEELVESIREIGQLDPIVVVKDKESNKFQIISGHRRWKAIQKIKEDEKDEKKKKTIVAICVWRDFKEDYQILEALIEFNRQRKKLPFQIYGESKLLDEIFDKKESRKISDENLNKMSGDKNKNGNLHQWGCR